MLHELHQQATEVLSATQRYLFPTPLTACFVDHVHLKTCLPKGVCGERLISPAWGSSRLLGRCLGVKLMILGDFFLSICIWPSLIYIFLVTLLTLQCNTPLLIVEHQSQACCLIGKLDVKRRRLGLPC